MGALYPIIVLKTQTEKGRKMKTIRITALAIFAAISIQAAPITVITNYFAGYVFVTNGWTTAEDSGLSTNTAYVAIPLASLPALTASAAVADGTNSDIRILLYAINDQAYTAYSALDDTNKPVNAAVSRISTSSSTTSYQTTHTLKTKWTASQAVLTPE
jgi:hypothetical protein